MKNIMQLHRKAAVLLLALFALLIPNACQKDLLDPVPINSLAEATAFATPDRFLSNLNGIYAQLKSGQH